MKTLSQVLVALLLLNQAQAAREPVLELEIRTDLKKVFEKPKLTDEDIEGDVKSPTVPGTIRDLAHPEREYRIEVRARGNTSRAEGEADFPKLRVEFEKSEDLKGTTFAGNRRFRINTHLSDKKKMTGMGRITGDVAPMRETLAYRLAATLGLATPNARLAAIHYVDVPTQRNSTHYGMLLESTKRIGERLGGKEIDELTLAEGESAKIDPTLGAQFFLFHKLIDNHDVQLRVNEEATMTTEANRAIWNSFIFELPNGSRVPVVYDLDLAGMVNGRLAKKKSAKPAFGLTTPGSGELADRVAPLFEKFTKEQLSAAVEKMKAKKSELSSAIADAKIDEEGRSIARAALELFFTSIDRILSMKVIAADDVRFFRDANLKIDKLRESDMNSEGFGTLRKGTPVRVIERHGSVLKVEIIPIKNVLKEKESSIGFIRANAPIADSLTVEQIRKVDARDMTF